MFVRADQLVCHAVGDYILQSDWMAINKRKNPVAALVHVAVYTLPFVLCLGADGYQALGNTMHVICNAAALKYL